MILFVFYAFLTLTCIYWYICGTCDDEDDEAECESANVGLNYELNKFSTGIEDHHDALPCYLTRLPMELHLLILDHLPRQSQKTLLICSSYFHMLIVPRIFNKSALLNLKVELYHIHRSKFARHIPILHIRKHLVLGDDAQSCGGRLQKQSPPTAYYEVPIECYCRAIETIQPCPSHITALTTHSDLFRTEHFDPALRPNWVGLRVLTVQSENGNIHKAVRLIQQGYFGDLRILVLRNLAPDSKKDRDKWDRIVISEVLASLSASAFLHTFVDYRGTSWKKRQGLWTQENAEKMHARNADVLH